MASSKYWSEREADWTKECTGKQCAVGSGAAGHLSDDER